MTSLPALAAVALALAAPGDATSLTSGPEPAPPPSFAPASTTDGHSSSTPLGGVGITVAGGALAAAASVRRRRLDGEVAPGDALGLRPPEDVIVVFVPGHASPSSAETFADLVDLMGLDPDQVRHFDYRRVAAGDHSSAASRALVGETARTLSAYIEGLAALGRPIHVVGYSKGGAAVAEMIERWDRSLLPRTDAVQGATLLDPPMARSLHGELQSVGRWLGLPHDGGYDAVECALLWWGCTDHRAHLGATAGIDVVVVRSPNAAITNFADRPEGLKVFEAPDDGRSIWETLLSDPWNIASVAEEAHEAVLGNADVAACIVGQMSGGGCGLQPVNGPIPLTTVAYGTGGTIGVSTL